MKLNKANIDQIDSILTYLIVDQEEVKYWFESHYLKEAKPEHYLIFEIFELCKLNLTWLETLKDEYERYYDDDDKTYWEGWLYRAINEEIEILKRKEQNNG